MSVRRVYERSFDEDNGKTISKDACPECSGNLRTVSGETRCEDCGLILNEYRIDHSATKEDFPDDETNTEQTGSPMSAARHDRGLSTKIGSNRDGHGNLLSSAKRRKFSRLRRYHSRARYRSKAERNLMKAFTEIARLVSALDLPFSLREEACTYFRTAQRKNLIQGRAIDSIAAGSVYAACRCGPCTRTLSEVASVAACSKQNVRNGYQVLNLELDLAAEPPQPTEFIPKIASKCGVSDSVQFRARKLTTKAVARGLSIGCQPGSIVAACLYLASKEMSEQLTQTEIADAADTTPTTIRTRSQELKSELQ